MKKALGVVVVFAGYSILTWGWTQLHGGDISLKALVWPGSFTSPQITTTKPPSQVGVQ